MMIIAIRPRAAALGLTASAVILLGSSQAQEAAVAKKAADAPRQDAGDPAKGRGPARKGAPAKGKADAAPKADAAMPAEDAPKAEAARPGEPSFARDVAPILVANCVGCHSPGRPGFNRGKLDMGSFEKLMKGGEEGPAAISGKPDESHVVLRVKGDEEPRMPPGNDARLGAPAIAAIEAWVKGGAKLDAGLDAKAPLKSYAASLQDVARAKAAQMSPEERDAKVKEAGLDRWKKANPALSPAMETTEHFALFSTLPKDKAAAAVKSMESQLAGIRRILGPGSTDWPEKVSLYVFSERKDFVEFLRTVKQREVDPEEEGDADMKTAQPYVAVAAPVDSGTESAAAAPRRKGRSRRAADSGDASRTLTGLLSENLARGAVQATGATPRWLAEGLGSYVASGVERRAAHVQRLRGVALDAFRLGWPTKAGQVLGGGEGVSPEEFRGVSFGLVECLTSPRYRNLFPEFLKGMAGGGPKLDEVVKDVYGATREQFLEETGNWIASTYGGDQ